MDNLPRLDPNTIPVGYIRVAQNGDLLAANRAFARYLAVDETVMQGKNLFSFTATPDDAATLRTILDALFLHPVRNAPFEIHLQAADSGTVTLSFQNEGVSDNNYVEFWVHDTSLNAQALDRSRVVRQRYDMALQATSDGLFDWDVMTGNLWTSRRFRQLLGIGEEEISEDPHWFLQRVHLDDRDKARQFTSQHSRIGQSLSEELRLRTRNNRYRWFQLRAVAQRDENGALTRLVGALTDIDELRRSVDALAESASMNAAILNNVLDALITIDSYGHILLTNPAAEKMFGYSSAEMAGQNVSMLMPSAEAKRHDQYIDSYKTTGKATIIGIGREVIAQRKDGQHFPINLAISEVRFEGRRLFIGTVRDLSESRRAEATLRHAQKMEALGQLTGGVAHDFNNLLTVVLGNLEMLEDDLPDGESREILQEAIEGATSGADLTRRLLAFSRKQPASPTIVSPNETVDRMLPIMRRAIREHININLECSKDLKDCIADSSQLDNSLLNLVLNARDAMPNGGDILIRTKNVTLNREHLKTRPGLEPGPYVALSVRDTGSGIPAAFQDRIFEPFFTSKAGEKGSGLGLSMVYGFVQQSGGHIEFSSTTTEGPDQGTEFRIFLPVAREDSAAQQSDKDDIHLQHGQGEMVLVVEDHPQLRQTATRMIKDLGYKVVAAEDEQTAIAALEGQKIDLVFTDMVLVGGGSGRSIIDRVKKDWPEIAIVMTSGYTEDEAWSVKPEKDIPFLYKPWRKQDVAHAFAIALQGRSNSGT